MRLEATDFNAAELRVYADQLREVLRVIDDGALNASRRERAFIAGALRAVELMQPDLDTDSVIAALRRKRRT